MQIAKLFATLGFQVDESGFKTFESKLVAARKATRSFSVALKTIRTRLNEAGKSLDSVNKKLDATKVKQANQRIASSANRLANAVERSGKGLDKVITNGQRLYTVISTINTVLGKGVNGWKHYNKELDEAKRSLAAITAGVKAIPNNKTVRVNQTSGGRVSPDRKSTRLNSSHQIISYAVFCLKKKKHAPTHPRRPPSPTPHGPRHH